VEAEASEEELRETKDELDEQLSALSFAETLLNNELNGAVDVDAEIAALETKIAEVKKQIEEGVSNVEYRWESNTFWIQNYNGFADTNFWESVSFEDWDGDGIDEMAKIEYYCYQAYYNGNSTSPADFDADALKASIQTQIDNLEAQLAIKQALADKYKAQLDALLGTAAE
jgi:hypothetical protein